MNSKGGLSPALVILASSLTVGCMPALIRGHRSFVEKDGIVEQVRGLDALGSPRGNAGPLVIQISRDGTEKKGDTGFNGTLSAASEVRIGTDPVVVSYEDGTRHSSELAFFYIANPGTQDYRKVPLPLGTSVDVVKIPQPKPLMLHLKGTFPLKNDDMRITLPAFEVDGKAYPPREVRFRFDTRLVICAFNGTTRDASCFPSW